MSADQLPTIDVHEAERRLASPPEGQAPILLDVREPDEFTALRVPGAVLLPISRFGAGVDRVPRDRPVLVLCRSGGRSAKATGLLRAQGWPDVTNIAGGIIAWSSAGLPTITGPTAPGEGDLPGAGDPPGA